ncbi:uncharacterized protein LOC106068229 [Biomphalaria glabrata]|uniref:Uncharacterized protein LOC106068229 n=1 Tax=Biomphalaria glabrata TaxID=6526 RepID=A0A9U8EDA4_BIOGL|nr:uncharacterized protein LOC106068229 [Biomphalaria glabrata]XP_013082986.2 uncharacterized protein LOC106068229 [Biomphalaria glabrata]XP_013082987.2 uncharacterized protein LOC106068229 [Biomphalaria glabrata]
MIMASQCWRTAKSCQSTETSASGSKRTCQAWFRCESAGDYVIRWRCHSAEDGSSALNETISSLELCSEGQQVKDCPPPVVCANDPYDEDLHITNDLSNDLILAIALASFAVLAIILIMASTYKYCAIRKRRHRRPLHPRQLLIRDFPYPVRYHNMWGANSHFYDVLNKKTSSPAYPSPFQDVYFSRPYENSRKFEHLLSTPDDSLEDFPLSKFRHDPTPRSGGKHKTDPSVVTGSFVFHQPGSAGVVSSHPAKEWSDGKSYSTKKDIKENRGEESSECYHIYRGNLSRFHHQDSANFLVQQRHYGKKDPQQLPDISAEFLPFPRLSSISIPSYGLHQGKSSRNKDKVSRDQQMREEKTERLPSNSFDSGSSRDSCGSISPYATGHLDHHSPKSHVRDNRKSRRGSPHSNSPDVISGHNFTNAFVRVGLNVYKALQTRGDSEGIISSRDFHASEPSHKKSSKKGRHHTHNNAELSYDSFRNEHLRELATKGAASSSTLEAGFRHKTHEIDTPTHSRY